ncbi:hypothetical protein ACFVIM_13540 [Streptomyces sp. NPDC057638]|uniref:hypothetical protein n=1 Tax=Streptomyces sp. NPDC057638 TaxID=3346190 RepID=UPI0036D1FDC1
MSDCPTCRDLIAAEKDAERVFDYARATDCRVLLRRHRVQHEDRDGVTAAAV